MGFRHCDQCLHFTLLILHFNPGKKPIPSHTTSTHKENIIVVASHTHRLLRENHTPPFFLHHIHFVTIHQLQTCLNGWLQLPAPLCWTSQFSSSGCLATMVNHAHGYPTLSFNTRLRIPAVTTWLAFISLALGAVSSDPQGIAIVLHTNGSVDMGVMRQ